MNKSLVISLFSGITVNFFVAFGIVLGGTLFSGVAAFINQQPPFASMMNWSDKLKIWGLVAALGGTFDSFMHIERIFEEGDISPIIKQIIFIISAFMGAHTCTLMLRWFLKGE